MTTIFGRLATLGAGLLALGLLPGPQPAPAQDPAGDPRSGLHQIQIPPQGDWARVITVTAKWLVLQDEQGRQYPVSIDAIGQFAMRWPTSLDRIPADALIEVTGRNLGNQRVQADHLDVYLGPARNLVVPTAQYIIGLGRVVTPFDFERLNTFGINLQYILQPGEDRIPPRFHVVAPPAQLDPLLLNIGGNNVITVVPGGEGMTMTQVTAGALSLVRPGDLAFCVANLPQSTARTLVLDQLVIYKPVPIDQLDR